MNPKVNIPVHKILDNIDNIILTKPINYQNFIWLIKNSFFIISDSGGIQEEAPTFGKPVLVLRDSTERPEVLENGNVILVGNDMNLIISETNKLIKNKEYYGKISNLANPYGNGEASKNIRKFIETII